MASPRSSSSISSSSPSLYPSSFSSVHSPPLLTTNFSSSSWSPSQRPSDNCARDQLENLIARHGHPTRVSLSSLEDLTATSSTYCPPSPRSPASPLSEATDSLETLTLHRSTSRPIPIPKPPPPSQDYDLPVTPLTGRFDKGYYFAHRHQSSSKGDDPPRTHSHRRGSRHHPRSHRRHSTSMRSDSSQFFSPVVSPSMSPTGRPSSPQPGHSSRSQNASSKAAPGFHLGNLPRFHPAAYQPSNSSQDLPAQPPSPAQSRQYSYRSASATARDPVRQYRDLMGGVSMSKPPSRPLSPSPSAPRLDPLLSPGPVTPLTLEEAGGYFTAESSKPEHAARGHHPPSMTSDNVEKRARETEKARQKARKVPKGR